MPVPVATRAIAARAFVLATASIASVAGAHASAPTVSVSTSELGDVVVRVDASRGEPILSWSGTGKGRPYRLALIWDSPALAPTGTLPVLPAGGMGPLQGLAWVATSTGTRLEARLSLNVVPHLRHSGGAWVLQLTAVPDPVLPADTTRPMQYASPAPTRSQAPSASMPPGSKEAAAAGAASTLLVLDVQINGAALPDLVYVQRLQDGRLVVPASTWRAARLRPPQSVVDMEGGEAGYVLDAAAGVSYRIDIPRLKLLIDARPEAFEDTRVTLAEQGRDSPAPTPSAGIYANYDASISTGERNVRAAAVAEAVAFNRWGSLSSGAALTRTPGMSRTFRTETAARRDFPGTMESLVIGDAISSAGGWSRPVRYGGIRFARDFSLAPGYVTMPMPTVAGTAALPSTMDILVNNQRQATTNVPPGPFALTNIPVVNGAGELNVVVRNLQGGEQVLSQSYYVSPSLLARGLSDFSAEAGAMRMNFGMQGDDYEMPFASGSYRLGWTDALTVGGRAELQSSRHAAGVDAAILLKEYAVGRVAAARALTDDRMGMSVHSGSHWTAALERITPRGGVSVGLQHFDAGFLPFAAVAAERRLRDSAQVGGGVRLNDTLNAGVSFTRQTTWEHDDFTVIGASLGIRLPESASLSIYANRLSGASLPAWSIGMSLVVPLEHGRTLSLASTQSQGRPVSMATLTQAAPAGPGWGWSVRTTDSPGQAAQGSLTLNRNAVQLQADVNAGRGNDAARVRANGSVGWLASVPFASRRIDDGAFAVVRAGGIEGLEVSRSNQVAAVTNADGIAVVTGLLPYQANQISIKAEELPLDVEVHGVKDVVFPYARGGVVVEMPVRRARNFLVVLQFPDGAPVPPGTTVTLAPGSQQFVVARRGEVYLTDVQPRNVLHVRSGTFMCTVPLQVDGSTGSESHLGPLTCGSGQ